MSILSWDDFEDDSQNRLHLNTSLRPSTRKTPDSQNVSAAQPSSQSVAAPQSAGTHSVRSTNPTDSMARASEALEHLDVALALKS